MLATPKWMEINYDKFNELLFGGKLPRVSLIINNRLSKAWGRAHCRFNYKTGSITPTKIEMVSKRDCPEEVLKNILVHEMIHIEDYYLFPQHYLYRTYWGEYKLVRGYDAHGDWFNGECERINSMNAGVTATTKIQAWEANASKLSDSAQAALDKRNAKKEQEGAIIGFLRKPRGKEPWFLIKTNILGKRAYEKKLLKDQSWYAVYTPYIEWYRTFDPKWVNTRNETSRGWYYSEEKKKQFISTPGVEFIERTNISYNFNEGKNMNYNDIIKEAINDYLEKETNDTIVTGAPGKRQYFKKINDEEGIMAVE